MFEKITWLGRDRQLVIRSDVVVLESEWDMDMDSELVGGIEPKASNDIIGMVVCGG